MASLTPGVLSKLLQNVDNKEVNVTGKHRLPLLQVIEIVPSFAGGGGGDDDDDLLRSSGFYVKVSDSLHSAYLLISDEDVDLIYSDKIQLGQFVYVSRLEKCSPVPMIRGIKPLPGRYPCVGHPKDFVSSDLVHIGKSFDFPRARSSRKTVVCANVKKGGDKKKRLGYDEGQLRRVSFGEDGGKVVGGLELRRLSLDSARRVWDQSHTAKATIAARSVLSTSRLKESSSSQLNVSAVTDKKVYLRKDLLLKCSKTTLQTEHDIISLDSSRGSMKKEQVNSSLDSAISSTSKSTKPELNLRTRFKHKCLDLPPAAHELQKGTHSRRNAAFVAAVNSLEEASASEGVLRCMSLFAGLCESSQNESAGSVVETFLNLYQIMKKTQYMIDSLMNTSFPAAYKSLTEKDATLWVQAAVESNLSKFSLFKMQDKKEILKDEKCIYVVLENTSNKRMSVNDSPQKKKISVTSRNPSTTKKKCTDKSTWSKGSGLKAASNLARELLWVSRGWFTKYLESSLEKGFGLRGQAGKVENASFLGKLKRVNEWLGDSIGNQNQVDERIERLRKKLYGFLLEHACSTNAARK